MSLSGFDPKGTMRASADYRHHARMCLSLAADTSDLKARALLLCMAGPGNNLAGQADRNRTADLVYETPPPQLEPQKPVASTTSPGVMPC